MKLFKKKAETTEAHSGQNDPADSSRRTFLQNVGRGAITAAAVGFGFQSIRSLVPNVLFESPVRVKIGLPTHLADGVTFLEVPRLYVFKEGKSFYAISASCTHLGCTVKYARLNQPKQVEIEGQKKSIDFEFQCPCHGSKYYADGTNYAGPAPRPLSWYRMEVSPDDGQLIVDMAEEVDQNYRLTV